jgi:chorismate-pyruvate lyase
MAPPERSNTVPRVDTVPVGRAMPREEWRTRDEHSAAASPQRFVHALTAKKKSRRECPRRLITRRYEMSTSLILLLLIVVILGFEVKIRINRR